MRNSIQIKGLLLAFALFFCSSILLAQPGNLDLSYYADVPVASIRSSALQSDGKVIIAGSFSTVGGVSRNNIARLETNGDLDLGYDVGTGFNGTVRSIAIQTDDKIIAAGFFTAYNGIPVGGIVRASAWPK